MTARELAQVRDLMARNRVLEHENRRLRALVKTKSTLLRRATSEARFLHGVLVLHRIPIPQPLRRDAA